MTVSVWLKLKRRFIFQYLTLQMKQQIKTDGVVYTNMYGIVLKL